MNLEDEINSLSSNQLNFDKMKEASSLRQLKTKTEKLRSAKNKYNSDNKLCKTIIEETSFEESKGN